MRAERPPVSSRGTTAPTLDRVRPAAGSFILPAGLVLVVISWAVAWAGPEPFRWYTFFPLWFGYILTVDGLNLRRSGTSFLTETPQQFAGMFVISMPFWWVFEALNRRLDNWNYQLPVDYPAPVYAILASLAFSTVVPALLETAALVRSFNVSRLHLRSTKRDLSQRTLLGAVGAGVIMLALVLLFPRQAFPLAWLSLFFMVDPMNALAGRPSLIAQAAAGRWSTIVSLFGAGITCGVFWELWNSRSIPKWSYDVPYVGFLKIFEMPILGYGGYLPFALEIYAMVSLATAWMPSMRRVLLEDRPADETTGRH